MRASALKLSGVKHEARQHAGAVHVHLDARDAGVGYLDTEQPVERHVEHVTYRDADSTGVADDQYMPPGVVREDIFPRGKDAVAKRSECFAARRRVTHRVAPETRQPFRVCGQQFLRGTSLPLAETDLHQTRVYFERQRKPRGEFLGECTTTRQWRSHDYFPRPAVADGRMHLRPAFLAQRIVGLAAILASAHRLAVANQVNRGWRTHRLSFPDTPASAKVAISLCSAHASRSSGTAVAAPLPSPRRMPRSSNGRASRAASTRACPGSAEAWA